MFHFIFTDPGNVILVQPCIDTRTRGRHSPFSNTCALISPPLREVRRRRLGERIRELDGSWWRSRGAQGWNEGGGEEKKAISCHLSLQLFRHLSLPPFLNSGRQFDRMGFPSWDALRGASGGRWVAHLGGWTAKRIFSVNHEQGS